jgi:hypothetical protein
MPKGQGLFCSDDLKTFRCISKAIYICPYKAAPKKSAVLEDFAHDVVSQDVRILGDFMFDHRRNFGDVELSLYLAKVVHSLMVAKEANDLARRSMFSPQLHHFAWSRAAAVFSNQI